MVKKVILILAMGLILTACGQTPNQEVAPVIIIATPSPQMMDINELADVQRVDLYIRATQVALDQLAELSRADAQMQARTRVAGEATAVVQESLTRAHLATVAASDATAESMKATAAAVTATSDYISMVQTRSSMEIAATRAFYDMEMAHNRQVLEQGATATAMYNQIRYDQDMIAASSTRESLEAKRIEAQVNRAESWSWFLGYLPWLIFLLAITAVIGAVVFAAVNTRPQVSTINGLEYILVPTGIFSPGRELLTGNQLMLPANAEPPAPNTNSSSTNDSRGMGRDEAVIPADWVKFTNWEREDLVPIGANSTTRAPVFINRNQEPHLIIVGATGKGKTASGLVPYICAMVARGCHAILINGRGSDFNMFSHHQNVTIAPRIERDDRPEALSRILGAVVEEMDRRDKVLEDWNKKIWSDLPRDAGESGEILVVIDEFVAIVNTANRIDRKIASGMWGHLSDLVSEARKFGIYVVITATDPTARVMGDEGMMVRSQMAVVAFGMKSASASRSILDGDNNNGFPRGSAGLPTGEFVYRVMGELGQASAFYPTPQQVVSYLGREVRFNPLPDLIYDAIEGIERGEGVAIVHEPVSLEAEQPEDDADFLTTNGPYRSRRQVALAVYGQDNGEGYARADAAIKALARRGVDWAVKLNGKNASPPKVVRNHQTVTA